MHQFSLVIATRNRAKALEKLLPELLQLDSDGHELIVVDNGSTDGTRQTAQSFPVNYLYFEGGLAEARHLGSLRASGKYVVYVDDDCLPGDTSILRVLARTFEDESNTGIIGSRIENVGFNGMQKYKGYCRFGPNASLEFEKNPQAADVFASMAITIRRDVYLKIGGFDPAFSRGSEEVDLCMKVKAAGYRLVYQPDAFLYHYQMGSEFRFNPVQNRDYMRLYSFFKFFTPETTRNWLRFLHNELRLFVHDAAQINRQYAQPNFRSTHLNFLNHLLNRFPLLRPLFRWPLMLGAILISPVLRRLFIPYIYWKANRRRQYEAFRYGLSYA